MTTARHPSPRALIATAAITIVVAVVALIAVLGGSGPERLGDNGRVGSSVGGFLDPTHRRACTVLQDVPDGTRTAAMQTVALDGQGTPVGVDTVRAATSATVEVPGERRQRAAVRVDGEILRVALPAGAARAGSELCIRQDSSRKYALSIRGVGPEPLVRDAPIGLFYEGRGDASWFDRAGLIADHAAVSRPANQGAWTVWVGLGLIGLAGLGGLAVCVTALTGRLGHGRRAVVAVAAVAVASAASWAFLSPPLQTPDSHAHISYVSYVAHHGRAAEGDEKVSSALDAAQKFTRENEVRFLTTARPPFTKESSGPRPASGLPDDDGGVVANAQSNPILYYAATAIPYRISGAGPFGGELLLRLLSALCFGVTVAGVLLALRELLPGAPRLAAVGALLVALLPQAAFVSGSVNPDALLFAVSSLLLWRLARAFRRGLDVRDGVILGLLLATASVSKLAGLMLVPGVLIAVVVLFLRHRRGDDRVSLRGIGALALAFGVPAVGYQVVNTVFWGQTATGGGQAGSVGSGSIAEELSYFWQFFLPDLGSMTPMFSGSPFQDLYVDQLIGTFGWNDTRYDGWVYEWGRVLLAAGGLAAVAYAVVRRGVLRGRVGELLSYLAILGAFLVLIAHLGYRYREDLDIQPGGGGFEQVRYLFPLLVFFAAMAVAALRLLGRRVAPHAAIVLVGLAGLLSAGGVLTTLGRFYG